MARAGQKLSQGERQEVFPGASDEPSSVPRGGPGLWLGCWLCTSSHPLASRLNGFPTPSSLRVTTEQPQLWSRLIHCFSPFPTPVHFWVYSTRSSGRNAMGVSRTEKKKNKKTLFWTFSLAQWSEHRLWRLMMPTGGDLGRHPCALPTVLTVNKEGIARLFRMSAKAGVVVLFSPA